MENKIKKLYLQDCIAIFFVMIILWVILVFVLIKVSSIVMNNTVRVVILSAGILVAIFATACSVEVLIHLKKNKEKIYSEELFYQEHNS